MPPASKTMADEGLEAEHEQRCPIFIIKSKRMKSTSRKAGHSDVGSRITENLRLCTGRAERAASILTSWSCTVCPRITGTPTRHSSGAGPHGQRFGDRPHPIFFPTEGPPNLNIAVSRCTIVRFLASIQHRSFTLDVLLIGAQLRRWHRHHNIRRCGGHFESLGTGNNPS